MELILRSIVTCLFVTYALGVEFKYPDKNTCIMAQININFTLSKEKEMYYLPVPQVDTAKSSCARNGTDSILALKWKGFNDTMFFNFMLNTGKVEMHVEYNFIPSQHFNDSKDSNLTILKNTDGFELSMRNMSYKCDSTQNITLKDGLFELVMSFDNVQVQAFGIENNTFSNFMECGKDTKTTVQTTTHHLTTTMKPPTLSLYTYPEKGSACILLEAAIQLDINYMDTKESVKIATVNIPKPGQVNITGHCAESDTGNASMALNWSYGKSRFSLKMDFIADMENAKLGMIEVDAELFKDNFPALHDNSTKVMGMKDVDFSSLNVTYYMCNSLQEEKLDNITVVIYKIRVQAFGVKNSNFTGDGTECSQELTTEETTGTTHPSTTGTTHPSTTETTHPSTANVTNTTNTTSETTVTTPTAGPTTPATPHPSNNYSVSHNNVTCVFLTAGMDFTFKYTMMNGTNTSILVSVPTTFTVNGSCDTQTDNETQNTTNEMNIYFNTDWSLKFVFRYDNSSVQLGDSTHNFYSIHSIQLDYMVDKSLFPGYNVTGSDHYTAIADITSPLFQSKVNGSYKCIAQTEVPFFWNNMTVTLETFNLQYKAFNKDNNTAFNGELKECSADNSNDNNKTNSVVPIAVGAALAGLVVIVLIAYLIGRRRNRKGYESV